MDAMYSLLLGAAMVAGIAVAVLAVLRRIGVGTAVMVVVAGAFCLVASYLVHSSFGHGPASTEPMTGLEFFSEHMAFMAVAGELVAALVLAVVLSRREPPQSFRRADQAAGQGGTPRSSDASRPQVFRSAVDWWYYALGFGLPIIVLVIAVLAVDSAGPAEKWVVAGVIAITILLPLWLLLSTRYTVAGGELRIRSGPISKKISVPDIQSVTPSHSMLSAPALSVRRLHIHYGQHGHVLISPADRAGFLRAIGFEPGGAA